MKVMKGSTGETLIFPFVGPDGKEGLTCVIVLPNRAIKIIHGDVVMDAGVAQDLIQALLHAVELVEQGKTD